MNTTTKLKFKYSSPPLTKDERLFLLKLVKPYQEYYNLIVGHPACSGQSKLTSRFIETLIDKLSEDQE